MSHTYHEDLKGFHPDQILHDGCMECEERGRDVLQALQVLDEANFTRAYNRALELEAGEAHHISNSEYYLLKVIATFDKRLHLH